MCARRSARNIHNTLKLVKEKAPSWQARWMTKFSLDSHRQLLACETKADIIKKTGHTNPKTPDACSHGQWVVPVTERRAPHTLFAHLLSQTIGTFRPLVPGRRLRSIRCAQRWRPWPSLVLGDRL